MQTFVFLCNLDLMGKQTWPNRHMASDKLTSFFPDRGNATAATERPRITINSEQDRRASPAV